MHRSTVLVVEDDVAELIRRTLTGGGGDVIYVPDGAAALDVRVEPKPDVLVLDVGLPGIDGLEVCRRLRSDRRSSRMPVLMLSARDDVADRVVGLELGADDYVIKAFQPPRGARAREDADAPCNAVTHGQRRYPPRAHHHRPPAAEASNATLTSLGRVTIELRARSGGSIIAGDGIECPVLGAASGSKMTMEVGTDEFLRREVARLLPDITATRKKADHTRSIVKPLLANRAA